ncbi:MAG: hypothetical protein DRQ56_03595 [Gammaproteobacteria bacterium]|nr:MAG: hypothetical protein DRQ56_03595 [Gammaproteobacteria bacterium]
MGDRSYVSLWIYDIPERIAEDVLEVLDDYGFTTYGTEPFTVATMLEVVDNKDIFFIEEASLSTADEVSDKLESLGVTHQSHQDPRYEYAGDLHRFHPDLGRWDSDANADADAIISAFQFRYKMRSMNDFWVKVQLGITYEDKFRELTGQKPLT